MAEQISPKSMPIREHKTSWSTPGIADLMPSPLIWATIKS